MAKSTGNKKEQEKKEKVNTDIFSIKKKDECD